MKARRKLSIYATVFTTGAAALVIEVVATRILSPYFGMTLFSVSSILAIILAGLSTGYWLGGKLADRNPNVQLLYAVVLAGGITVGLLEVVRKIAMPMVGMVAGAMTGPLLGSLMLFFVPALFLGMTSPIAIRILTKDLKDIGEVAGKVFFFGTVGSIVGSLGTGFVLIPNLSIPQILIGTSMLLVGIGLAGLRKKTSVGRGFLIFVLLFSLEILGSMVQPQRNGKILHEEDSQYQHIRVMCHQFAEGEGRLLMLDRSYSGASYLHSDELPFPYTRYYKLYELTNKDAKRFLYLGGGSYSMARKLLSERVEAIEVVVVEIDPRLPEIAKQFFGLKDDPRLERITADARGYLIKTQQKFDMIFIDVFNMDTAIPPHLMTVEFFQEVYDHLNDQGVIVMNVAASIDERNFSLGLSAIKTFRQIFPRSEFIASKLENPSLTQNILFWGVKDDKWIFDPNSPIIRSSETTEIRNLDKQRIDLSKIDLSKQKIFTDDYAPVEFLAAKSLKGEDR